LHEEVLRAAGEQGYSQLKRLHEGNKSMGGPSSPATDRTAVDVALLAVRVVAGVIFTAHGAQKLFGAFGGTGLEKATPVTVAKFFGGLGLIVGLLTRFSAASLIVVMLGAIRVVHGKNGFFQSSGGFEYNLALIGLLLPTLVAGPGRFAIGRFLPFPKNRQGRPIAAMEEAVTPSGIM
jgi:putative oxidoreductase